MYPAMRKWVLLLSLLVPCAAQAFTSVQHGPYLHAGPGLAIGIGSPVQVWPAWRAGGGWWLGRYDEVYALGRYTAVGLDVRQGWRRGVLSTQPMLEVRRGTDVLVIGYHAFLAAGPEFAGGELGLVALLGAGLKWRFKPHLGLMLRVGGGVAWMDGATSGRGVVELNLEWSQPLKRSR